MRVFKKTEIIILKKEIKTKCFKPWSKYNTIQFMVAIINNVLHTIKK